MLKICKMGECGKLAYAKDLCKMHYTRYRRTYYTETCVIDKCNNIVEAKNLCSMHYQEERRRSKGMKPMFTTNIVDGHKTQKLYISKRRKESRKKTLDEG